MQNSNFFIPGMKTRTQVATLLAGASVYYIDSTCIFEHGAKEPVYVAPAGLTILDAKSVILVTPRLEITLSDHQVLRIPARFSSTEGDNSRPAGPWIGRCVVYNNMMPSTSPEFKEINPYYRRNPVTEPVVRVVFYGKRTYCYRPARHESIIRCGAKGLISVTPGRVVVFNILSRESAGIELPASPFAAFNPLTGLLYMAYASGEVRTLAIEPFAKAVDVDIHEQPEKTYFADLDTGMNLYEYAEFFSKTAAIMTEGDFCRMGQRECIKIPFSPLPPGTDLMQHEHEDKEYSVGDNAQPSSPGQSHVRKIKLTGASIRKTTNPKRIRLVRFAALKSGDEEEEEARMEHRRIRLVSGNTRFV